MFKLAYFLFVSALIHLSHAGVEPRSWPRVKISAEELTTLTTLLSDLKDGRKPADATLKDFEKIGKKLPENVLSGSLDEKVPRVLATLGYFPCDFSKAKLTKTKEAPRLEIRGDVHDCGECIRTRRNLSLKAHFDAHVLMRESIVYGSAGKHTEGYAKLGKGEVGMEDLDRIGLAVFFVTRHRLHVLESDRPTDREKRRDFGNSAINLFVDVMETPDLTRAWNTFLKGAKLDDDSKTIVGFAQEMFRKKNAVPLTDNIEAIEKSASTLKLVDALATEVVALYSDPKVMSRLDLPEKETLKALLDKPLDAKTVHRFLDEYVVYFRNERIFTNIALEACKSAMAGNHVIIPIGAMHLPHLYDLISQGLKVSKGGDKLSFKVDRDILTHKEHWEKSDSGDKEWDEIYDSDNKRLLKFFDRIKD